MKFKEKITSDIKKEVSKPLGRLFGKRELLRELNKIKKKRIIAVGDATGKFLTDNGFVPFIWVYDGKIMRKKIKFPLPFPDYVVENPRSHISGELKSAIDDALKKKRNSRIFVIGEEDLATLYFIFKARNSIILYGQPKKGIVMIEVNPSIRKKTISLLKKMA